MSTLVRVAVLGGGVGGVVAAAELARSGQATVDLLEPLPELGGTLRSFSFQGASFDIGTFRFFRSNHLFLVFPRLMDLLVPVRQRLTFISPQGTYYQYPNGLEAYVKDNGWLELVRIALDVAWCRAIYRRRDTFEAWIHFYIGRRLFEYSGLRAYAERFCGLSFQDIDIEFARSRLYMFEQLSSIRYQFKALRRRASRRRQEEMPEAILVRPPSGFQTLFQSIQQQLQEDGVSVYTRVSLSRIRRHGAKLAVVWNGQERSYDRVISTLPVSQTLECTGSVCSDQPRYIGLLSLFYFLRGDLGHDAAYLYNFSGAGSWKRMTTFSLLYGLHDERHYFTTEFALNETLSLDAAIAPQFEHDARKLGFLQGELQLAGHSVTPYAYPLYRRGQMGPIHEAKKALAEAGIDSIGRQGALQYISSAAAAASAAETARQISATSRIV